jgi:hypothetical protein
MAAKLDRLERSWRSHPDRTDPGALARPMFTIVGDERVRLAALTAPAGEGVEAVELDDALLEFENRLTDLIHLEALDRRHVVPAARKADDAGAKAREAATALGLDKCAAMPLAVSPSLR